mgnify:CR=1 FL=1
MLDVHKPPPRLLEPLTKDQLVLVDKMEAPHFQAVAAHRQLDEVLGVDKLDAVLCVAGGWAGGNAASDGFLSGVSRMFKVSTYSAFLATHLASKYLHRYVLSALPHHPKKNASSLDKHCSPTQKGSPGPDRCCASCSSHPLYDGCVSLNPLPLSLSLTPPSTLWISPS